MPSPISRAHGSFPNESYNTLKIDLSHLEHSSKRSCSTSSTPRRQQANGSAGHSGGQTADFSELLRQLRDKEKDGSEENGGPLTSDHMKEYQDEDDVDRTSPKSAPNTDEGFGTFTKTTPRGKDSASSEGSDDHTDCEVDHLGASEPSSITEWWDRIEMPAEVTIADSSLFKHTISDQVVSRIDENGSIELAEDELMCMIDNIGMNGIKASSGLASAQETELRLLHILKERDDLVLSYHGALKELSKLTARIKDENHLLRKQLNMTDLSHSEIVLALEEQASDGRRLALSLQDDLTDTEVNILSRLREDKHVLEDRLAALEHQYNADIAKWKGEASVYRARLGSENLETGEITRENHMLKLQIEELRNMFDVTMGQTQEECNNYLQTIETLKDEISKTKSPVSDSQLDSLALRQTEMERLYESMISTLEGDNSRLLADLEELQQEVAKLKLEKAKHDKACGTGSNVTDSGVGTDCTDLVNRSMNTSLLSQSTKGTETLEVTTAVKSVSTDADAEVVELQRQVSRLETTVSQGDLDRAALDQQKSGLLENHRQLSERLGRVESQLQMTQHKLTTLQAVHELVLSKNESLERDVQTTSGELSSQTAHSERVEHELTRELEKARAQSLKLSSDVSALRQRIGDLEAEAAEHRRREVQLNSEITKLTLERSTLQGRANTLNHDLVQQKAQHVSQSLRVQQLEASKAHLESQVEEFKRDSLELFKQLESARQEKDDLNQQLGSLHSQLSESMSSWQSQLQRQHSEHNEVKSSLESDLSAHKSHAEAHKSECERLTLELGGLRNQLRESREVSEATKRQLGEVMRTARIDETAADAASQLNEQLKSLQQQTAEFRFTTSHFRTENGQLQLRVNQLEELNKATEQRNAILQRDLTAVQASLDDSYSSADAQLNLLDLSSSDLMSIDDTSELRNYILAAKRQVEMMQSKRAKSNVEYSRKISEMEQLVKNKSRTSSDAPSSDAPSSSDAESKVTQSVGESDCPSSSATDFIKLPPKVDMNSSYSSSSYLLNNSQVMNGVQQVVKAPDSHGTTQQVLRTVDGAIPAAARLTLHGNHSQVISDDRYTHSYQPAGSAPQTYIPPTNRSTVSIRPHKERPHTDSHFTNELSDYVQPHRPYSRLSIPSEISEIELSDVPDSLSMKVQSLTNRPGTSTPTRKLSPRVSGGYQANGAAAVEMSAIESENAALKAELEFINSDRNHLHKHMQQQSNQHDVLNDTLDELEKSLEEVYDSNKLLRNTLGDCNQFIQTNILSKQSPASPHRSPSALNYSPENRFSRSLNPASRSQSVTPVTRRHHAGAIPRPHSVTPGMRSQSMAPSIRPHSVTPAMNSNSSAIRSTPSSVSFGGSRVNTYFDHTDRLGWSAQSDRQMTSSSDFNKLQQTNVDNYESLLHSDTNTKSPTNRSVSATKSSDLNHRIRHSLSRLNQETSAPLAAGFTLTPERRSQYTSSSPAYI